MQDKKPEGVHGLLNCCHFWTLDSNPFSCVSFFKFCLKNYQSGCSVVDDLDFRFSQVLTISRVDLTGQTIGVSGHSQVTLGPQPSTHNKLTVLFSRSYSYNVIFAVPFEDNRTKHWRQRRLGCRKFNIHKNKKTTRKLNKKKTNKTFHVKKIGCKEHGISSFGQAVHATRVKHVSLPYPQVQQSLQLHCGQVVVVFVWITRKLHHLVYSIQGHLAKIAEDTMRILPVSLQQQVEKDAGKDRLLSTHIQCRWCTKPFLFRKSLPTK